MKALLWFVTLFSFFMGCKSDDSFRVTSGSPVPTEEISITPSNPTTPGENPGGIAQGHFDLDTSTRSYDFNRGDTNKHIHEYDEKYDVLGADFFELRNDKLDEIDETINESKRFVIIMANSQLSESAFIEINGQVYTMKQYREIMGDYSNLKKYVLGSPQVAGDIQLKSFSVFFPKDILAKNGLIASEPKCVIDNKPGANGEYRYGALLAQAIDLDSLSIDPVLKVASIDSDSLLWEAAFFWHKDGVECN